MECRNSEGFASMEVCVSVTRHLSGRYGPLKGAENGNVTVTKIENLHKDTRIKTTDSKNAIVFDL